jgi:transcriptional regulator with XRE-family HTH domain
MREIKLTSAQVRAARALLKWSQQDLAAKASLFIGTIKDFERGVSNPRMSTLLALEKVFRKSGVEFIEPEGGKGPGLRFSRAQEAS